MSNYDKLIATTLEKWRRPMLESMLGFSLDDYTDEEVQRVAESLVESWSQACSECGRPYKDE